MILFNKRWDIGDITIKKEKFIESKPNHQKLYIIGDLKTTNIKKKVHKGL